jgi:hypothetical protein
VKISTKAMGNMVISLIMLFLLAPLMAFAANKVVVIPLFGNDCATVPACKTLKNVITVAKANGNFTDLRAAVDSITDASETNPYLVVIGPGVYTIQTSPLIMKPYVDIAGSGENITKITGATCAQTAVSSIIAMADHSTLSSLKVENTGGCLNAALYIGSGSPQVSNVTATAIGGTYNYGIYNSYSSPMMINVTATAPVGTTLNYGIYNSHSSPTMINVTATASTYGVYNYYSNPKIRHSTMDGGARGLITSTSSTATVSQSTIIGGADVMDTGTNKCVACDNGSGTALGPNCN